MEDNWADKTSVGFVIQKTKDNSTRVFHVKTQSSSYVLGFFGLGGARPFAMMRGMSSGMGHEIDLRDSDPRVGERSLLATPVSEWMGQRIDMAGTKTSAIATANEETNPVHTDTLIRTLMQPAPTAVAKSTSTQTHAVARSTQEERPREKRRETPYPENYIEYIESLASMLRNLASNGSTLDDIMRQQNLVARLKVALMNARVASDDIVRLLG